MSKNPDHRVELGIQPTGHFVNPADAEMTAKLAAMSDDERERYLDGDDEMPAPAAEPKAETKPEEPDGEGNTPDVAPEVKPEPEPAPVEALAPPPAPAAEPEPVAAAAPVPAPVLQQPAVQLFQTRDPKDIAADKESLLTQKAEAFKKYSDGTMAPEDYEAVEREVLSKLSTIGGEEAMLAMNRQIIDRQADQAITAIKLTSKAAGLDYDADQNAVEEFNASLQMLSSLAAAKTWSLPELYQRAHNQVLALRGLQQTAPTAKPMAARAAPPNPPTTLRNVPPAASTEASGGLNEELARLTGQAFENRWSTLTPAQQAAYLGE